MYVLTLALLTEGLETCFFQLKMSGSESLSSSSSDEAPQPVDTSAPDEPSEVFCHEPRMWQAYQEGQSWVLLYYCTHSACTGDAVTHQGSYDHKVCKTCSFWIAKILELPKHLHGKPPYGEIILCKRIANCQKSVSHHNLPPFQVEGPSHQEGDAEPVQATSSWWNPNSGSRLGSHFFWRSSHYRIGH